MNNYERIKMMSFEEMTRLLYLRTHCINCPMKYTTCKENIRKCSENTQQWLLEETTMEAPIMTFKDFLSVMIVLFFMALGCGFVIEKLYHNFW